MTAPPGPRVLLRAAPVLLVLPDPVRRPAPNLAFGAGAVVARSPAPARLPRSVRLARLPGTSTRAFRTHRPSKGVRNALLVDANSAPPPLHRFVGQPTGAQTEIRRSNCDLPPELLRRIAIQAADLKAGPQAG
ncbi:hypothetical protein GCM10022294_20270 [Dietzia aurantiaca]